MDVLKNLASVISLQKARLTDEKLRKLYKMAQSGMDDETAIQKLFPTEKNPEINFRRIKERLINRLIKSLLFTPTEGKTDYNSTYSECWVNLAAVKVLTRAGIRLPAIQIAEKTIRKSSKFEMAEISFQLALILSNHYAQLGDRKKRELYKSIYNQDFKKFETESEARLRFYEILTVIEQEKKPAKEIIKMLDEIASMPRLSFEMNVISRRAALYKSHLINDAEACVKIVREAVSYLDALPFCPAFGTYYLFYNKQIPALISTSKYQEAVLLIDQCIESRKEGYRNWHSLMIYKAVLGLYSEDYATTRDTLLEARSYLENIPEPVIEQWLIIEAHLSFLHLIGKVSYPSTFRLSKFLNETAFFAKDKVGANASILVLKSVIYLAIGDRDKLIDSKETILQYTYNYLETAEASRANLMIRIIREIGMSKFDHGEFLARSKEHYAKLVAIPRTITDLETELIPYERLYGYILEMLE